MLACGCLCGRTATVALFALAVAVLALGLFEWSTPETPGERARAPQGAIRAVSAATLILLGIFGANLNAGVLLLLVATVLVIHVALDIYRRVTKPRLGAADTSHSEATV